MNKSGFVLISALILYTTLLTGLGLTLLTLTNYRSYWQLALATERARAWANSAMRYDQVVKPTAPTTNYLSSTGGFIIAHKSGSSYYTGYSGLSKVTKEKK